MAKHGKVWRSFLCLFAQEHLDFRLQELVSLASLAECELRYDPTAYSKTNPFLVVQLNSEDCARKIISRAMLIRSMFELWGWGRDYTELEASVKQFPVELMEPYMKTGYTFKLIASGFSKKCTVARQKWLYERLSFLPLQGTVDLKNPDHEFHILEDYGDNPNRAPPEPHRVFLGRFIGHGQRHLIQHYSVKTRHFIGNTSMDAQLSLIMSNQAQVKQGSFVYDPFAGTGSLLVACAHHGGYVLGADIDRVLLHGRVYIDVPSFILMTAGFVSDLYGSGRSSRAGSAQKWRGKGESVLANLQQYGLGDRYIDVLVADAAQCVWRQQEIYDAIITDPPYGIREGARKIGSRKADACPVLPEQEEGHIPAVCSYKLSDVFGDLLDFAARFLVVGGRLVYWLPVVREEFSESLIPTHPCLRLVAHSEQPLQRHVARRLITMEKHIHWTRGERQSVSSSVHDGFREKYFR